MQGPPYSVWPCFFCASRIPHNPANYSPIDVRNSVNVPNIHLWRNTKVWRERRSCGVDYRGKIESVPRQANATMKSYTNSVCKLRDYRFSENCQ